MQKIWAILILCSFSSWNLFQSKDAKTQESINQEMLNFDWNDVNNYPLFENCDETLATLTKAKVSTLRKVYRYVRKG